MKIKLAGSDISCIGGDGENLLAVLKKHDVFVENPCGGIGVCGKCKVWVKNGNEFLSEMTEEEKVHLKPEEIRQGARLACFAGVCGDDGMIELDTAQKIRKHRVLAAGYLPEFEPDGYENGYGVAVDIGTTTAAMSLIDLKTGTEISGASDINAQKIYGLDVLTRITYEYEHGDEGIRKLQTAIVDSMNAMLGEMCSEEIRAQIREIVVAANCTMTHMLLGVDARTIGRSPYTPVFTKAQECMAADIGICAGKETKLYCIPQVSSYIGADIVAGAYVCQLDKRKGNTLFIDIGTNGEIILASNGRMLSCSCAAGPALEGMNIRCGMRAADGAVEEITMSEDGVQLRIIGDGEPVGLCGSGILAAVREMIKNGFLKKTGALLSPETLEDTDWRKKYLRVSGENGKKREVVFWSDGKQEIVVTQDDVRQVQLAKGAILSGFTVLLERAGISMDDLDQVLIAGQFGAHLPAESLVGVGILPAQVKDKLFYVGNSSKNGAYMALMSRKAKKDMEKLAEKIGYFELAETKDYERMFAECMRFPV